jgi:hypothetical protein
MPKYMVPTVLMRIDAMPLNRNDKIDYKLLPAPAGRRAARRRRARSARASS